MIFLKNIKWAKDSSGISRYGVVKIAAAGGGEGTKPYAQPADIPYHSGEYKRIAWSAGNELCEYANRSPQEKEITLL